jgi:hypothetical protein
VKTSVVQLFEFIKNQQVLGFNYFRIREPPVAVLCKKLESKNHKSQAFENP